jgi:hypothetical protein
MKPFLPRNFGKQLQTGLGRLALPATGVRNGVDMSFLLGAQGEKLLNLKGHKHEPQVRGLFPGRPADCG